MSEASSQADHADLVSDIIAAHQEQPGALLPILHALQDELKDRTADYFLNVSSTFSRSVSEPSDGFARHPSLSEPRTGN